MRKGQAEKLAKKLLETDAGRNAIGAELGVKLTVNNQSPAELSPDRPIVAALIPCYKQPEPAMMSAYMEMKRFSLQNGIELYEGPELQGSSVIHWARNFLLAELIKTKKPWTHVLFMDDDIVPPKDALVKLLSHKKDIVAGVCTKRIDPPLPNIMHSYEKDGNLWFRGMRYWQEGELIEVGGVGTGFILISRSALEQIADVYFLASYEKEVFGISEEVAEKLKEARVKHFDRTGNAFWFRFLGGLAGADEYGEDISFSLVAKRYCGITVYADTSVQPGHIGKYPYCISDFIAQRDLHEKMRDEGNYQIPELKSDMKISICCPTRGRPESVRRLVKSIGSTMEGTSPELIFYVDEDDDTKLPLTGDGFKVIRGPRQTLSNCWNDCAKAATGDILMFCGDDVVFQTKGWDKMVINTFESHPDKFIFVHGNDGHWGSKFGTHGFVHRKWVDTLGYLLPPYFVSDYGDTWINDVANLIGRRVYLNFSTQHMHPAWGTAELDQTHRDRIERGDKAKVEQLYAELRPKLLEDVEKLRAAIRQTPMPEEVAVG